MPSFASSMRLWKSSMFSNTTARPRCCMSLGVAAEGLMIAPSGHRVPRRTAVPACGLEGRLEGMDDVAVPAGRVLVVVPDRLAVHRQGVLVQQVVLAQLAQHRGQT